MDSYMDLFIQILLGGGMAGGGVAAIAWAAWNRLNRWMDGREQRQRDRFEAELNKQQRDHELKIQQLEAERERDRNEAQHLTTMMHVFQETSNRSSEAIVNMGNRIEEHTRKAAENYQHLTTAITSFSESMTTVVARLEAITQVQKSTIETLDSLAAGQVALRAEVTDFKTIEQERMVEIRTLFTRLGEHWEHMTENLQHELTDYKTDLATRHGELLEHFEEANQLLQRIDSKLPQPPPKPPVVLDKPKKPEPKDDDNDSEAEDDNPKEESA